MKKINAVYVSLVALVVAIAALVMCIVCCCKGGEAVDVEKVLMEKPEIVAEAMQNHEIKKREEARKKAQEMMAKSIEELNNNPKDGTLGNPDGKVVLVEFFDFSCGYCHRVYPVIKNLVAKNPELKVVAKPMTFLSPMSKYAAKATLAAKEQGKFAEVYSAVFEIDGPMTEAKIDEAAVKAGASLEKLKADMESEAVKKVLDDTSALASKLQIRGVPSLILNGKVVQTLDEGVLQEAIDSAK